MKKTLYKYYMQFIDEIICMANNEMVVAIVSPIVYLLVSMLGKIFYMQKCKELKLWIIIFVIDVSYSTSPKLLTNAIYVHEFFFDSNICVI